MKELSLNILDIAQNSVSAGATLIEIALREEADKLTISVKDNGCGMSEEFVKTVADPFSTTRKTRKVGMGIPLLKLAAEQTGGTIRISSKERSADPIDHGTTVEAVFYRNHLDFTPLGDVISTVVSLIQGSPDIDFVFTHYMTDVTVELDTRQMRVILGEDIPLNDASVLVWVKEFLAEQYPVNQY